ncbi:hypothetical protein GE061_001698 [Apolygus lucorum]|uniref:DDE Tnp4 domain-containing protein n=1 Tax=Apolygus lucorum TaxID=248454 RepID=A0A8S9Y9Q9_APOLU|nr:hypothetical protein GE061_001698 [Apolygus lucorum]
MLTDSDDYSEDEPVVSDLEISNDDDEELELFFGTRLRPKNENFIQKVVRQYNDVEFVEDFRVSYHVAVLIANRYRNSTVYSYHVGPYGKVEAYEQVLIFLWFVGNETTSFRAVSNLFDISKSALAKILKKLIFFVSDMSGEVITWPTEEEMQESERYFRLQGFPGAIGAIDGSHIKVDKPESDPESFITRKCEYAVQLQAVCNHKKKIIDLYVGYPGSVHDARVFSTSPLAETLQEKCGARFILADSAYPCLPNMITPYRDTGNLEPSHVRFNKIHSKNRCVVEHCFGLLKQKFRQLYHLKLRKMESIVHFIRACAVLHNLALEDDFPEEQVSPSPVQQSPSTPVHDGLNDSANGQAVRDNIRRAIIR